MRRGNIRRKEEKGGGTEGGRGKEGERGKGERKSEDGWEGGKEGRKINSNIHKCYTYRGSETLTEGK